MEKVGLVLEGGGMRGLYTIGVLDCPVSYTHLRDKCLVNQQRDVDRKNGMITKGLGVEILFHKPFKPICNLSCELGFSKLFQNRSFFHGCFSHTFIYISVQKTKNQSFPKLLLNNSGKTTQ